MPIFWCCALSSLYIDFSFLELERSKMEGLANQQSVLRPREPKRWFFSNERSPRVPFYGGFFESISVATLLLRAVV